MQRYLPPASTHLNPLLQQLSAGVPSRQIGTGVGVLVGAGFKVENCASENRPLLCLFATKARVRKPTRNNTITTGRIDLFGADTIESIIVLYRGACG